MKQVHRTVDCYDFDLQRSVNLLRCNQTLAAGCCRTLNLKETLIYEIIYIDFLRCENIEATD